MRESRTSLYLVGNAPLSISFQIASSARVRQAMLEKSARLASAANRQTAATPAGGAKANSRAVPSSDAPKPSRPILPKALSIARLTLWKPCQKSRFS